MVAVPGIVANSKSKPISQSAPVPVAATISPVVSATGATAIKAAAWEAASMGTSAPTEAAAHDASMKTSASMESATMSASATPLGIAGARGEHE
jgi:hypothetical protein